MRLPNPGGPPPPGRGASCPGPSPWFTPPAGYQCQELAPLHPLHPPGWTPRHVPALGLADPELGYRQQRHANPGLGSVRAPGVQTSSGEGAPPSQDLVWEPPSQGRGLGAPLARGRGMGGGCPSKGVAWETPLPADVVGKGDVRFQGRDLGASFRVSRARQRSPTFARGVPWLPLSSQKIGGRSPHRARRSTRPASAPSPSGSS